MRTDYDDHYDYDTIPPARQKPSHLATSCCLLLVLLVRGLAGCKVWAAVPHTAAAAIRPDTATGQINHARRVDTPKQQDKKK